MEEKTQLRSFTRFFFTCRGFCIVRRTGPPVTNMFSDVETLDISPETTPGRPSRLGVF